MSQIFRMVDRGARSGVCVTDILNGGQMVLGQVCVCHRYSEWWTDGARSGVSQIFKLVDREVLGQMLLCERLQAFCVNREIYDLMLFSLTVADTENCGQRNVRPGDWPGFVAADRDTISLAGPAQFTVYQAALYHSSTLSILPVCFSCLFVHTYIVHVYYSRS